MVKVNCFKNSFGKDIAQFYDLTKIQYIGAKDIFDGFIYQSFMSDGLYVVEVERNAYNELLYKIDNFKIYYKTVLEMIKDKESGLYIKTYINDLMRSKDISILQTRILHNLMIDNIGGFGFVTFGGIN